MKILITGGAGKTGLSTIRALKNKDSEVTVRAFIHRESQRKLVKNHGADEIITGDMMNPEDMKKAMCDIDTVYHICPTADEREYEIGRLTYSMAEKAGVKRFVYHSVLHSIFSNLPHHEKKHMVEEMICEGEIPYVILKPAAFMQNLMTSENDGVFMQRFFNRKEVYMNLVDLEDVAEIAAEALTENKYDYGTYELCGPENLSEKDIIDAFKKASGKNVESGFIPDDVFEKEMKKTGKSDAYINTLLTMFWHYQNQGFMGNSTTLELLLGKKPITLEEYIKRENNI